MSLLLRQPFLLDLILNYDLTHKPQLTKARLVQVTQVISEGGTTDLHKPTITISDKFHHLNAALSFDTANTYRSSYGKPIASLQGSLIVLLQYSLRAYRHQKDIKSVFMRVDKFRFVGCEGERAFGRPQEVTLEERVKRRVWQHVKELEESKMTHQQEAKTRPQG